jgi:hypothetical protein
MTKTYFIATRQARYSLLFALPLLLLYEGLAATLSHTALSGIRNGADVLLKTAFIMFGGKWGLTVFGVLLFGWAAVLVWKDFKENPGKLSMKYMSLMLVESVVYAALFGSLVANLTSLLLQAPLAITQGGTFQDFPFATQLVVSLGAGLYEELMFRVLLVSGALALGKWIGLKPGPNIALAVISSALIFSGFHYIGPYGDPLTLPSFTFRAIAGVLLSGLYVARGFGIVAWTHALYDVSLASL